MASVLQRAEAESPQASAQNSFKNVKPLSVYDKVQMQIRRLREYGSHTIMPFQRDCTIGEVPQEFVPTPPRYTVTAIPCSIVKTEKDITPNEKQAKASNAFQRINDLNASINAANESIERLQAQKNDNLKQICVLEHQKRGIPSPPCDIIQQIIANKVSQPQNTLGNTAAVRVLVENNRKRTQVSAENNEWTNYFAKFHSVEEKLSKETRRDVSSTQPYMSTLFEIQNTAAAVSNVISQNKMAHDKKAQEVASAYKKDTSAWWRRMAGEDSVSSTARVNALGINEHGKRARTTRSGKVFLGDAVSENDLQGVINLLAAQDSLAGRDDIFIDRPQDYVDEEAVLPEMICGNSFPEAQFRYTDKTGFIKDPIAQDLELSQRCVWRQEEKDLFVLLFTKFHKKFDRISAKIPGKSTEDVINFYYRNKFALGLHVKGPKNEGSVETVEVKKEPQSQSHHNQGSSANGNGRASVVTAVKREEPDINASEKGADAGSHPPPTKIQAVSPNDEWTEAEIAKFREGYAKYGKNYKAISLEFVKTKNDVQCRHFFSAKRNKSLFSDIIPPSHNGSGTNSGLSSPQISVYKASSEKERKEFGGVDKHIGDTFKLQGKNDKGLPKLSDVTDENSKSLRGKSKKHSQTEGRNSKKFEVKLDADGEPIPPDTEQFSRPPSPQHGAKKSSQKTHSKQSKNDSSRLQDFSSVSSPLAVPSKPPKYESNLTGNIVHLTSLQPQTQPVQKVQQTKKTSQQVMPNISVVQYAQTQQTQPNLQFQIQQQQQQFYQQSQIAAKAQASIQQPSLLPVVAQSTQLKKALQFPTVTPQQPQVAPQQQKSLPQVQSQQTQSSHQHPPAQPQTRGLVVRQYNPSESPSMSKKESKQYGGSYEKKNAHGNSSQNSSAHSSALTSIIPQKVTIGMDVESVSQDIHPVLTSSTSFSPSIAQYTKLNASPRVTTTATITHVSPITIASSTPTSVVSSNAKSILANGNGLDMLVMAIDMQQQQQQQPQLQQQPISFGVPLQPQKPSNSQPQQQQQGSFVSLQLQQTQPTVKQVSFTPQQSAQQPLPNIQQQQQHPQAPAAPLQQQQQNVQLQTSTSFLQPLPSIQQQQQPQVSIPSLQPVQQQQQQQPGVKQPVFVASIQPQQQQQQQTTVQQPLPSIQQPQQQTTVQQPLPSIQQLQQTVNPLNSVQQQEQQKQPSQSIPTVFLQQSSQPLPSIQQSVPTLQPVQQQQQQSQQQSQSSQTNIKPQQQQQQSNADIQPPSIPAISINFNPHPVKLSVNFGGQANGAQSYSLPSVVSSDVPPPLDKIDPISLLLGSQKGPVPTTLSASTPPLSSPTQQQQPQQQQK